MVGIRRVLFVFSFIITQILIQNRMSFAATARFGVSPDNNQELLLSVLKNAKRSLIINIYEFVHPAIADQVIKKIQEGVCTNFLIEGDPVGGITAESVAVLEKIATTAQLNTNPDHKESSSENLTGKRKRDEYGVQNCHHLYILPPQRMLSSATKRRFKFNHAKYVVADDKEVLISSENFSINGHPNPGLKGTRGWDIAIEDTELAEKLTAVFDEDSDLKNSDVRVLDLAWISKMKEKWAKPAAAAPEGSTEAASTETEIPLTSVETPQVDAEVPFAKPSFDPTRKTPARPIGAGTVNHPSVILSPNAAPALRGVISSATHTLDMNFMSLPKTTPILDAIIDAARSGTSVRLLLNDSALFAQAGKGQSAASKPAFVPTASSALMPAKAPYKRPWQPRVDAQVEMAKFVLRLATCDNIPIDARIINAKPVEITYIHNKGMILDGDKVLVSSINGTANSMENNREVAVFVESPDAAKYYGEFFESDWNNSPVMDISAELAKNPCRRELIIPSATGPLGFFPGTSFGDGK